MIRDPFDSNNDQLSMSDAMMGDLRAEMHHGRFSSLEDDHRSVAWRQEPSVSFGFIDYLLDSSVPLRRRFRNTVLWVMTVGILTIFVSIAMTKLAGW